ncbi:MAG TPA: hypothetical protein VK163_04055 [Opitutaceae bacterium]|nr:hypothetical protein [Opitutaceae bacterium]
MISLRAPRSVGATIAALALVLAGCREEPVRTYRTSKETLPPTEMPPAPTAGGELPAGHPPLDGSAAPAPNSGDTAALPPGHPPIGGGAMPAPGAAPASAPDAANDSISWAAPDHWVAKPLGAMRRGSFTAKNTAGEADCSIFVFPAASNPLLANINRWRGQVGLAPLTEAQLAAETTAVENAAGLKFVTVELLGQTGAGSTRVLGAILYRGEEAWFFKLSGPDAVVAAEKPAFLDFLRTVHPANS